MTRTIGRSLLAGYRWQIEGNVHNTRKSVMVFAPHTSSWDFLTTHAAMLAIGFRSSWLIADTFTWWPLGIIMRWLGGIPVNRSTSNNIVSQIVQVFNEHDELIISLSPEGTRRKQLKWKTGFWHIAVQAGVPIQLVSVDYCRRVTTFGPIIEPSQNLDSDMKQIQSYYKNVSAKKPNQFGGEYL